MFVDRSDRSDGRAGVYVDQIEMSGPSDRPVYLLHYTTQGVSIEFSHQ